MGFFQFEIIINVLRWDRTGLATIWRHWRAANLWNSPNLLHIFSKMSPSFPNVLLLRQTLSMLAKRSLEVLEMNTKFTRLFGDPDILPQISKQSLFSPNIHEVVANYSPGKMFAKYPRHNRHLHQTVAKQSSIRRLIATFAN